VLFRSRVLQKKGDATGEIAGLQDWEKMSGENG